MHMRKKKWARPELDACPRFVPDPPAVCGHALTPDCTSPHTVIPRRSNIPGRISIILVGEDLGY